MVKYDRKHQKISSRYIVVGSGRRDLLYFQDKVWKTKQYRQTLQGLKAQELDVVNTISVEHFGRFLQARSEHSAVPSEFYEHTIARRCNRYFLFHKIHLSAYFSKQRADQKRIQNSCSMFGEENIASLVDVPIYTVDLPWQHQIDIAYGTGMVLLAPTTCKSFGGFDIMELFLICFAGLQLLLHNVEDEQTIKNNQELE
ncbi:hypothetical protein BCV72DRAFT_337526 [Rhizopus microsporus var. microsporus]|uniref:Uncharacterized protein n=1 Tax=Rhizopus microsporus var. microsporus TaxID=86635 RepID=A0A1X0QWF1_RHIZD|nr:hypothetical protein BCV72DRAFT_337526 [Rhizopus microsporus var. microsporus]